tara:strand:- start:1120 stop:1305 length:186 start_codon:yes stop_codon:yes gene_type:complete
MRKMSDYLERNRRRRKMLVALSEASSVASKTCAWAERKFRNLELYFIEQAMKITIPREDES